MTVEIDRLVLRGLNLTAAEMEQLRSRLSGELQAVLSRRRWTGGAATIERERVNLAPLSRGELQDSERLASEAARGIAGALEGVGRAPGGGKDVQV